MTKFIDLAKKIKALAERGVDGEKENAELQLKKIMQKHGFTMEDIEGEKVSEHYFVVPEDGEQLFAQIAYTVFDKIIDVYIEKSTKRLSINCTAAAAMEVESKFEFYYRGLKEEYKIFFAAFVRANNLYRKSQEAINIDKSSAEYKRAIKVQRMSEGIDRRHFLKQIEE